MSTIDASFNDLNQSNISPEKLQGQSIILIDCYGFLFRAYHVYPKLTNSQGLHLGAIYGFANMLTKLILDMGSDMMVAIYDAGGKNFRHDIYNKYKANRPPLPEDLCQQLAMAATISKSLGIPTFSLKGFEADDLIATFVRRYSPNNKITIVSSDKDLMQLIRGDTIMYDPLKKRYIDTKGVEEKFGVGPELLCDLLAIIGDASDNIPGIKGLGPKSAAKLLLEFGSLENIFANLDQVESASMKKKLDGALDIATLSKRLIALEQNAPIEQCVHDVNDLRIKLDVDTSINYFKELEFVSLLPRIKQLKHHVLNTKSSGIQTSAVSDSTNMPISVENDPLPDIKDPSVCQAIALQYQQDALNIDDRTIMNPAADFIPKIVEHFIDQGICCIDFDSEKLVLAITSNVKLYIWHFKAQDSNIESSEYEGKDHGYSAILEGIMQILGSASIAIFAIDIKHIFKLIDHINSYINAPGQEIYCSRQHDNLQTRVQCLNIAHYICYGHKLTYKHIAQILSAQDFTWSHLISLKAIYSVLQRKMIQDHTYWLYKTVDIPLSFIIWEMESIGIRADSELMEIMSTSLSQRLNLLEEEIYKIAGEKFNINSPKQLSEILFDKLKLNFSEKKNYSTDISVLEKLQDNGVLIADHLIKWRTLSKLKHTYTDGLQKYINNGKVHTTFDQTHTTTGRLSSQNPNMQNLATYSEDGINIKTCFQADPGEIFISADYSQIELRILAVIANVAKLKQAFGSDLDIHMQTAVSIFNVHPVHITPEQRRMAKTINFGIIYGMGQFGLAKRLGISNYEAKTYIEKFFTEYPEISEYMKATVEYAKQNGYVKNSYNRKIFLDPDLGAQFFDRAAINAPIQSTAADIMKMAMIKVREIEKIKIVLQVHDEVIVSCVENQATEIMQKINDAMNLEIEGLPLKVNLYKSYSLDFEK